MRRLVRHLAGEPAQLGHIVQQQGGAQDFLRFVANRRGRQLDRALAAIRARQQQCAAAQIYRGTAGECLPHRIGQQASIHLVHQPDQVLQRLAERLRRAAPGHPLRRRIHETDASVGVRRDDCLGERVQGQQVRISVRHLRLGRFGRRIARRSLLGRRQPQRRHGLCRDDFHARNHQRRAALVINRGGGDLEATRLTLQTDHVDLIALRGGLAREPATDVVVHQLRVFRRHQVGEPAPNQLHTVHAHEARELAVGIQNDVAVNQHRLVDSIAQLGEQLRHPRIAFRPRRGARQQMVDGRDERRNLRAIGLQLDAPVEASADCDPLQLL